MVTIPGWTEEARAWALRLAEHEALQCPRGHDLTESSNTDWLWKADEPLVCLACVALEHAMDKTKDLEPAIRRAQLHSVRKVPAPRR